MALVDAKLVVDGCTVALTEDGFLVNGCDWNAAIAEQMAAQDGLLLTDQHWEIIDFVRTYYDRYRIVPIMRILARSIAKGLGIHKGKTRYLYGLFPEGPVRQASRYGGLPKPPSCI